MRRRAYGYVRVSTEVQAESGLGLEAQRSAIVDYCLRHELDLVDVVSDEGVSGSIPLALRPGGAELLARLKAGDALVLRFDRAFRGGIAQAVLQVDEWGEAGIELHFVDKPSLNVAGPARAMMVAMFAWMAELEREYASERTTAALRQRRLKGGAMNGQRCFGYVLDSEHALVEDHGALAAIGFMLLMQEAGKSLRWTARWLNERGVRQQGGRELDKCTVQRALARARREGYPPDETRCKYLFWNSRLASPLSAEDRELLEEVSDVYGL